MAPRSPGREQATDVLKVIGTLERADFEWLTLRPLDQLYTSKRQTRAPKGRFEALMALMHEPPRGQRKVALAAWPTFGWTEAQVGLEPGAASWIQRERETGTHYGHARGQGARSGGGCRGPLDQVGTDPA